MTSDVSPTSLRGAVRRGMRELSAIWWWFLIAGVFWTLFGNVRPVLSRGQRVRGGRVRGLGVHLRRRHPARRRGPGSELALAVRRDRDPWGDRRDHHLGLARIDALHRVDLRGLVPDRVRNHAPGQCAGGPQGGVVVDRTPARGGRAGPGRVGCPLLSAVAADADDPGRGVGHLPRGVRDLRRVRPARGWQPARAALSSRSSSSPRICSVGRRNASTAPSSIRNSGETTASVAAR
jgi:hypothetical protein